MLHKYRKAGSVVHWQVIMRRDAGLALSERPSDHGGYLVEGEDASCIYPAPADSRYNNACLANCHFVELENFNLHPVALLVQKLSVLSGPHLDLLLRLRVKLRTIVVVALGSRGVGSHDTAGERRWHWERNRHVGGERKRHVGVPAGWISALRTLCDRTKAART